MGPFWAWGISHISVKQIVRIISSIFFQFLVLQTPCLQFFWNFYIFFSFFLHCFIHIFFHSFNKHWRNCFHIPGPGPSAGDAVIKRWLILPSGAQSHPLEDFRYKLLSWRLLMTQRKCCHPFSLWWSIHVWYEAQMNHTSKNEKEIIITI